MWNIILTKNMDCFSGTMTNEQFSLAPVTFYHFGYSNRLEPRMAYSNWRAPMRGGRER